MPSKFTLKYVASSKEFSWPDQSHFERLVPSGKQSLSGILSPDRSRALTLTDNSRGDGSKTDVQLWDFQTGRRIGKLLEFKRGVTFFGFSPDSRNAVATSYDGTARLMDAGTGKPIASPLKHDGSVHSAAFSPDSQLVVTCGIDKTARLWKTKTGKPLGKPLAHIGSVNRAAFSPTGEIVATLCDDNIVRLWDVRRGAVVCVFEYKYDLDTWGDITFQKNGSLLLIAGFTHRILDVASQQEVSPPVFTIRNWLMTFNSLDLKFSEDGRFIVSPIVECTFDLTPDNHAPEDLAKLGQLYSEHRLDAKGGTAPLRASDLQALWRDLRVKYPEEFVASSTGVLAWRHEQLNSWFKKERPDFVAFHRRWLAAELAEAGWQPGVRGNEDMERDKYLQRLCALALHDRHGAATAAADDLAARWPKDTDTLYGCARVHALAAGAVQGDAALAERYAARAVALLRQAIDAGYEDSEKLRKDTDLDALRQREDFRALLKKRDANQP